MLGRYFTNLDGPVFALVNLPEVVKGRPVRPLLALVQEPAAALPRRVRRGARRRRRHEPRRLGRAATRRGAVRAGSSASTATTRSPSSAAVHLACEQSSNVLTKILERGRLMSYLEQSTRYIPYDSRLSSGHYRYHRDPAVLESPLGARYVGEMDRMFDTYAELLPELAGLRAAREPARRRRLRARPPPGGAGPVPRRLARPAAGRVALQCRDLRLGTELRAARCSGCGRTRCPRRAATRS